MRVIFAPDWTAGNEYQALLAQALGRRGVEVIFPRAGKRWMPLLRGIRPLQADLLHLHWPEAYFPSFGDRWDSLRRRRFRWDLALALGKMPLVYTAHNTFPHRRGHSSGQQPIVVKNVRKVLQRSAAVFVHSTAAEGVLKDTFGTLPALFSRIAHGDLSVTLPRHTRAAARQALGLGDGPLCLMFGAAEPYKGIEDVLDFWRTHRPGVELAVVGKSESEEYKQALQQRCQGVPGIRLNLQWEPNERLALWMAAADCTVFNYREILTSGAASLARSLGLPILIPRRLATVDLSEPHPRVRRFDSFATDFAPQLARAAELGTDYESAMEWRAETSWDRVAEVTAETYRKVLAGR